MRTEEEIEKKKKDLWAATEKADDAGWDEWRNMLTMAAEALEWALGSEDSWLEDEEGGKKRQKEFGLL